MPAKKSEIINIFEKSNVPDRLKLLFFSGFSTSCNFSYDANLKQADVIFVTAHIHIDIIKDIIAIKIKHPEKKCFILSTEPCRSYVLDLCEKYVNRIILFKTAFELGMLLSEAKEGTPVITRHRIPQLVFATYSFPLRHIYKPYGFLYTVKLRGPWENYINNDLGYAEAFMIQNSQAVYHLEGDQVGKEIFKRFGIKTVNIYPGCMDQFNLKAPPHFWDKNTPLHIVYASSEPHKYIFPYAKDFEKQEIHLHVYLPYYYNDTAHPLYRDMKMRLAAMLNETYVNPYLHLHPEFSYSKLVNEISRYDFAFPFFDIPATPTYTPIASNFFMALEAGLPLIVPSRALGMKEIVEKYGIGYAINIEDIKSLRDRISMIDYPSMKKNIYSSREGYLKFDVDAINDIIF